MELLTLVREARYVSRSGSCSEHFLILFVARTEESRKVKKNSYIATPLRFYVLRE